MDSDGATRAHLRGGGRDPTVRYRSVRDAAAVDRAARPHRAVAYAYSFIFFTSTVVFALIDGTKDWDALNAQLGWWVTIHGVVMVIAGLGFGLAVIRAGVFPRWSGVALMAGVVLVAVSSALPALTQSGVRRGPRSRLRRHGYITASRRSRAKPVQGARHNDQEGRSRECVHRQDVRRWQIGGCDAMRGARKRIVGGVALATGVWAMSYPALLRQPMLDMGGDAGRSRQGATGRRSARHCRHRLDARRYDRRTAERGLALAGPDGKWPGWRVHLRLDREPFRPRDAQCKRDSCRSSRT